MSAADIREVLNSVRSVRLEMAQDLIQKAKQAARYAGSENLDQNDIDEIETHLVQAVGELVLAQHEITTLIVRLNNHE